MIALLYYKLFKNKLQRGMHHSDMLQVRIFLGTMWNRAPVLEMVFIPIDGILPV